MRKLLSLLFVVVAFPVLLYQAAKWRKHHSTGNYSKGHKPAYKTAHADAIERSLAVEMEL